ncbi:MAG TPA: type II toxin-antitoxin system PemK/MazF family toxin [Chloroflexota bacterium]|nr:type II toxin-antitoxin system PemK/MazF family toxin [Chloroflexota bacterium]
MDPSSGIRFRRGTIVLLGLDPTVGHEQRGVRPCVVVSDPDVIGDQRFPMMAIVPITGTPGQGALYPMIEPGPGGLVKRSYALIDHLRSVDKRRIRRIFGVVSTGEMEAIDQGLVLFLGLEVEPAVT